MRRQEGTVNTSSKGVTAAQQIQHDKKETRKKMDKDRFRQGLGSVVETYIEVAQRIGLSL